jgi:hypothetical protein
MVRYSDQVSGTDLNCFLAKVLTHVYLTNGEELEFTTLACGKITNEQLISPHNMGFLT